MGIIIDLGILLFICLSVYLGYRKGLIELSIRLCAFVIALVVTLILYKPIANTIIEHTQLDETIQNTILAQVNQENEKNTETQTHSETKNNTGEKGIIEEATEQVGQEIKQNMLPEVAKELSIQIIQFGVMLILFLAIKIALRFVTAIANWIAKLPIIKQFNKAGGLIYGLIRGVLVVLVILFVVQIIGQINEQNPVHQAIQSSILGKEMYEHNPLESIIQ